MSSKENLLARMSNERDKLLLAVAGLAAGDAERKAIGDWSVKDIAVHITACEEEAARRIKLIREGRGAEIRYFEADEMDAWNATTVEEHKDQSWAETIAKLAVAHEKLMKTATSISEELYTEKAGSLSISEWLPGWTAEHDAEHAPEILKWRDQQRV